LPSFPVKNIVDAEVTVAVADPSEIKAPFKT
jgi:hypothetical protein